MAYEVLGDLVAKVSTMSFENYVRDNILKPLGMTSSTLLLKEADPTKLAAGHTRVKDGALIPVAHYPYNRSHTPSSNLHSTASGYGPLDAGELKSRRARRPPHLEEFHIRCDVEADGRVRKGSGRNQLVSDEAIKASRL